ncbi:MAG: RNA ligase family protein [Clostridia bacterium]
MQKRALAKAEKVVIQEKIDGSNTAILNDNGKIRYFSRSQEINRGRWFGRIYKIYKS